MNAIVDHSAFALSATADTAVSLFDFKGHQIRVVMIDGEPWFVARDVGTALHLLNTTAALRNITQSEVRDHRLTPQGRANKIISESGLYKLILRSDKPQAKSFQDWVTKEVLPAIRKDGAYIAGEEKVATGEMSEDEFVLRALEIMQKKIARLTEERDIAQANVTEHLGSLTVDEWRAPSHLYLHHGQKTRLGRYSGMLMDQNGLERQKQKRTLSTSEGLREIEVNVYPKHILDEAADVLGLIGFKVAA